MNKGCQILHQGKKQTDQVPKSDTRDVSFLTNQIIPTVKILTLLSERLSENQSGIFLKSSWQSQKE